MDKAEYISKLEQINSLAEAGKFKEAAVVADEIDWKHVKSVRTLSMIGEIYEADKRYEDSRNILKFAYRRSAASKNVLYRLTELSIRTGKLDDAKKYLNEFEQSAPNDNSRHILHYKLLKAEKAPLDDQIAMLKEYKEYEYTERWAYELARLYKRNGQNEKCIEECDDMILWFSEGRYVMKAMELKMQISALTPSQQALYDECVRKAEEEKLQRPAKDRDEKDEDVLSEQEEQLEEEAESVSDEQPVAEIEEETPEWTGDPHIAEMTEAAGGSGEKTSAGLLNGLREFFAGLRRRPVEAEEEEDAETAESVVSADILEQKPAAAEEDEAESDEAELTEQDEETAFSTDEPVDSEMEETEENEAETEDSDAAEVLTEENAEVQEDAEDSVVFDFGDTENVKELEEESVRPGFVIRTGGEEEEPEEEKEAAQEENPFSTEIDEALKQKEETLDLEKLFAETAGAFASEVASGAYRLADTLESEEEAAADTAFSEEETQNDSLSLAEQVRAAVEAAEQEKEAQASDPAEKAIEEIQEMEALPETVEEETAEEAEVAEESEEEAEEYAELESEETLAVSAEAEAVEIFAENVAADEEASAENDEAEETAEDEEQADPDEEAAEDAAETAEEETAEPEEQSEAEETAATAEEQSETEETAESEEQSGEKEAASEQPETEAPAAQTSAEAAELALLAALEEMEELGSEADDFIRPEDRAADAETAEEVEAAEPEADPFEEEEIPEEVIPTAADEEWPDEAVPEEEEAAEEAAEQVAEEPEEEKGYRVTERETDESLGLTREFHFKDEIEKILAARRAEKEAKEGGEENLIRSPEEAACADVAEALRVSSAKQQAGSLPAVEGERGISEELPMEAGYAEEETESETAGQENSAASAAILDSLEEDPTVMEQLEVEGRKFTAAEEKAFSYFANIPGIDYQVTMAIADVHNNSGDKTSRSGNIVITGRPGSGKTKLAGALVLAICMNLNIKAVKSAQIVAEDFNKKDPAAIVKKMAGGFLTIEAAGSLSESAVERLNKAMEFRTDSLVVILEDEKQDLQKLFDAHPEFAAKFTSKINIPIFTNDELVAFGKVYAKEIGYKMDEMATLALYTMIGDNQKESEPVTVSMVREMIDKAAERSSRKFRFGKNNDKEDGMTVLHEKDFHF